MACEMFVDPFNAPARIGVAFAACGGLLGHFPSNANHFNLYGIINRFLANLISRKKNLCES